MAVADVLSQRVPESVGAVGRLGGEEFAILLPRCDEEGARQAAESIRSAVESARVATPLGEIVTTTSIGCAAIAFDDTVSTALQKADEALYEAKRGGRNRVAFCRAPGGGGRLRERPERGRREAGAYGPLERSA
jgi:diguanylate cyclase (GGDEF)-like protein